MERGGLGGTKWEFLLKKQIPKMTIKGRRKKGEGGKEGGERKTG